jgi:hypothetical protein
MPPPPPPLEPVGVVGVAVEPAMEDDDSRRGARLRNDPHDPGLAAELTLNEGMSERLLDRAKVEVVVVAVFNVRE